MKNMQTLFSVITAAIILLTSLSCSKPKTTIIYRKKPASNNDNNNNYYPPSNYQRAPTTNNSDNAVGSNNSQPADNIDDNTSDTQPSEDDTTTQPADDTEEPETQDPPVTDGFVFVGASNVGNCKEKGTFATGELLKKVMTEHPDAIVWGVGDNQYNDGSQEEYDNCYNASGWGDYLGKTLAAVGDHDKDLNVWINNFSDENGSLLQDSTVTGETYFSYERGNWLIVGLDSQNKPSGQLAWLENLLQNSSAPCTLAMWHHPGKLTEAYELLYKYGADVILLGHAHYYQRFSVQDAGGNVDNEFGIRQFIVATGGASLSSVSGGEASQSVFGITKFVLGEDAYSWEFMPIEGTFKDQGSAKCHGAPPADDQNTN